MIAPGPELRDPTAWADRAREEAGIGFEVAYGVADVLRRNELDPPKGSPPLPLVARVPEGEEAETAARLGRLPGWLVGAAAPDYLVRPTAPIAIDDAEVGAALHAVGAHPGSADCGTGCVVAILDSGIDPHLLQGARLHPRQYDALSPDAPGAQPADATGHGSLVARIAAAIAPGAEIVSVRTFGDTGTISGVVAALYLAQAAGPADVVNLSFGVSCAPTPCSVCMTPASAAANISQLNFFFQSFMDQAPDTVFVAAAGNATDHLTMPAAFDNVIAVGSFDHRSGAPDPQYRHVPPDRFVMAPGGTVAAPLASRPGFAQPEPLYGTSFAAPFVTGLAAKTVCHDRFAGCGTPRLGAPAPTGRHGRLAAVLAEIAARADTGWRGYDAARHGLGALRF